MHTNKVHRSVLLRRPYAVLSLFLSLYFSLSLYFCIAFVLSLACLLAFIRSYIIFSLFLSAVAAAASAAALPYQSLALTLVFSPQMFCFILSLELEENKPKKRNYDTRQDGAKTV